MYPDFDEALSHLQKPHVKIYRPEELRGGGLLKYAYLRQNDFRDDPNESSESLRLAINVMVPLHPWDNKKAYHTSKKLHDFLWEYVLIFKQVKK